MRKSAIGMIHEVKLDCVTLTDSYELPGNFPTEGPKVIFDSLGDREVNFPDLELNDDLTRLTACDAGWNHRGSSEDRVDDRTALTGRLLLRRTALSLLALCLRCRWNKAHRPSHTCRHSQKQ